jgi:hypothetical protein
VLLALAMAVAHPSASAASQRLLAKHGRLVALVGDSGQWCQPIVDLVVVGPSRSSFSGDRVELQELLGTVRAGLSFECPGVVEIAIRGVVSSKTIYRGEVKSRDGWILKTVQPVRTQKPKPKPKPATPVTAPKPKPKLAAPVTAPKPKPKPAAPVTASKPKPAAPVEKKAPTTEPARPPTQPVAVAVADPPVKPVVEWYGEGVKVGKLIGAASVCGMPRPETKNRVVGARGWAVREGASPSQTEEFGQGMSDGLMHVEEHGHNGSCESAIKTARTQQALRE